MIELDIKIPNHKFQITNKFQMPNIKIGNVITIGILVTVFSLCLSVSNL